MNSGNSGSFNRLRYDRCAYEKDLHQSVEPLQYRMYAGQFENCGKCVFDDKSFYRPFDDAIVDMESELKGITRLASTCPQNKYSPTCKKSKSCTSTWDVSVPIVMAQEVCPIVKNNIRRMNNPGYELNVGLSCK